MVEKHGVAKLELALWEGPVQGAVNNSSGCKTVQGEWRQPVVGNNSSVECIREKRMRNSISLGFFLS